MSGSISIGVGGIAGWRIVQRSEAQQIQRLAKDPIVQRSTAYFQENITRTTKAEELVKDYRLLSTALSAFGLEADIANKAFIQKVLESDVTDKKSLVNRLADKRYLKMAEAFGFGSAKPANNLSENVSKAFVQREFERRIGEGDETLRFALNARRELQEMGTRTSSDKTLWYEILGSPPLRKVFEGALGFGTAYGKLPIDRQYEEFTRAAERTFGSSSLKHFTQPDAIDRLVKNYMVRSQINISSTQNRYSAALTLLSRN